MNNLIQRDFFIRSYEPADRDRIRYLCCETGFLGEPIDPVFEDREVFADFLVNYYVDREPESAFVIGKAGVVLGYLLGSRFNLRRKFYRFRQAVPLLFRVLVRFPRYRPESRKFVRWMLLNGWRETPPAPRGLPHFHINLLPEARTVRGTRELIGRFLSHLEACGERGVYGQMVTMGSRRGERLFERYGFRVLNRSEITKYRDFYPEPVYLCTVVKDFRESRGLNARDIHRAAKGMES